MWQWHRCTTTFQLYLTAILTTFSHTKFLVSNVCCVCLQGQVDVILVCRTYAKFQEPCQELTNVVLLPNLGSVTIIKTICWKQLTVVAGTYSSYEAAKAFHVPRGIVCSARSKPVGSRANYLALLLNAKRQVTEQRPQLTADLAAEQRQLTSSQSSPPWFHYWIY